jgi:hypothetical protein
MVTDNLDLEALYTNTTFRIECLCRNIDIRVGQKHPQIDALLSHHGCTEWAFITAWNPASRPAPADQNALAQAELLQLTRDRGFSFYEGDGIPDQTGWAPERSVWIAGINRREAIELGRQFGQNAIVVGSLGGVAELVNCNQSSGDPGIGRG